MLTFKESTNSKTHLLTQWSNTSIYLSKNYWLNLLEIDNNWTDTCQTDDCMPDHWLELQPVGTDEAIVVDFEKVESVIVREADGSIVSPSQQMSLWVCRFCECQHLVGHGQSVQCREFLHVVQYFGLPFCFRSHGLGSKESSFVDELLRAQ